MKEIKRPKIGDRVQDRGGNVGTVIARLKPGYHNIDVEYDNGGRGYHCLIRGCIRYDPLFEVEE